MVPAAVTVNVQKEKTAVKTVNVPAAEKNVSAQPVKTENVQKAANAAVKMENVQKEKTAVKTANVPAAEKNVSAQHVKTENVQKAANAAVKMENVQKDVNDVTAKPSVIKYPFSDEVGYLYFKLYLSLIIVMCNE